MTSVNDHHDASRDQYISHKLYLERRAGNRYYNLGYAYYKEGIEANWNNVAMLTTLFRPAWINFEIALLFNKNDVDAKARKKDMCDEWVKTWTGQAPTTQTLNTWTATAKKEYRECKC